MSKDKHSYRIKDEKGNILRDCYCLIASQDTVISMALSGIGRLLASFKF